jgi:TRAP-type C4-dicarboxylate transport system permease small subunit
MRFRTLDYVAWIMAAIGGLALVGLIAITGWQVWGRYVLNDTPTWAERLSLLLILVVSLPLAAVGLRENFHLGISFFAETLPKKAQRWLDIFNTLLLGLFGVAMAAYSWQLVVGTWNRNIPLLGVPQAFQYLPLVICGALIVLFMAERLWFQIRHHDNYYSDGAD